MKAFNVYFLYTGKLKKNLNHNRVLSFHIKYESLEDDT